MKDKVDSLKSNDYVKNLVIKITEAVLPIVFWLGLLYSAYMAYSLGTIDFYSSEHHYFRGLFYALLAMLGWVVTFYFMYLIIDIRDNIKFMNQKNDEL